MLQSPAEDKRNYLRYKIDGEVPEMLVGDATRLNQVLSNLTLNAIKFTTKGTVTILVELLSQKTDEVTLSIKVVDTGVGIPYDKQASIFDRYEQAHAEKSSLFFGVGLGLGISKRLVEQQGGTIDMESQPGTGTTFSVTLPFKIGNALDQTVSEDDHDQFDLTGYRVLVVDDSPINILVAREFLQRWDVEVLSAKDGHEALEIIKTEDLNLVLMDLQMPGWTGYRTAREIRKLNIANAGIPIIAMSADVLSASPEEIREAGMDEQLVKPFHPKELRSRIVNLLRTPTTAMTG
jgi:CheY-like chemotaxis protein